MRMVDAAREAARAVARGDGADAALDRGRQVAPSGAVLSVTTTGDAVEVSGRVEVDGAGGLLEVLPSVELTADAVSAREDAPP